MELTQGRGVDVIIENIGGAIWNAALKCLVRGGRIVTCGATIGDQPPADLRRIFIRQLRVLAQRSATPLSCQIFSNGAREGTSSHRSTRATSSMRLA